MSKTKCPTCGSPSIRLGATKCPSCQAWVTPPKLTKRRLRLSPFALVCFAAGLCVVGMVAGVFAAATALGRRPAHRPVAAPPVLDVATSSSAVLEPSPIASVSSSATALPSVAAPTNDPPAAAGKFVKIEQVRLDAPPVDILYSGDETLFFVLCEDGTVRAHDVATGAEKRRVKLPGRGKGLRALPESRFAVVGLPADLVVIDVTAWRAGGLDPTFLKRIAVRDVVDIAAVGEPPTFVAATGQGGKVIRLSSDLTAADAEFVSVPPVRAFSMLRVSDADRLVMFIDGRLPADSGAVVVFDPAAAPFGGSRATWSAVIEPRTAAGSGSDRLLMFDPATATVVDFGIDGERRVAPSGPQPLAAFRLVGDRAIVVGAAGEATVVSFGRREVQGTLPLGGLPSAAVSTPDHRVVVVALGGGLRGRGATTVVLSGDPLAVESTVETGEGSHVIGMAPKGQFVAVGATLGKTVTLLSRR